MTSQLATFLALIFIAISSSLLGVFVLWKRLSYFGDAVSHSILLGAALGAIFSIEQGFSLIFFAILFALFVNYISQNNYFSKDTIIAISSYFCVALALLLSDLMGGDLDFSNYIFGDIANVAIADIARLAGICILTIIFVFFSFKKLLLINISSDLARVEKIKIEKWNLFFLMLLTLVIAVSVKIVGVLLMTALLVFPAAISRMFSHNALQMIINSFICSISVCAITGALAPSLAVSVNALIIVFFGIIFISATFYKK